MKKVQITHHTSSVNVISAPHPLASIDISNITQQGWDFRAISTNNSMGVKQVSSKRFVGKLNAQ